MKFISIVITILTISGFAFGQNECQIYLMVLDTLYSNNFSVVHPNEKYPIDPTDTRDNQGLDTSGSYKEFNDYIVYINKTKEIVSVRGLRNRYPSNIPESIVDNKINEKTNCSFVTDKYCIRQFDEGSRPKDYSKEEFCDKKK